ncbi:RBR-type E3 ubiquitin transferase [Ranunculus cassubicifolius]
MVEIVEEEHSEAPQTSEVCEDNKDLGSFTCEICIEPISCTQKFKNHMKNCFLHSYCLDCIAKYIEAKIEEYNAPDIICPGLDCAELLDPLECQSLLPARVFDKWCNARCESTISEYRSAHCPFEDCSALILNECGEEVMKSMCPNCKKWLCFDCQVSWHAGYRCDETGQARDENDLLAGELIEKMNWKRCPVCKHGVERSSGCPQMRCRCRQSFC